MTSIQDILHAASSLIEPTQSSHTDLRFLLISRLRLYHERLGTSVDINELDTETELRLKTAESCLYVIQNVQHILEAEPDDGKSAPAIGTRDIGQLRTLLAIVFKWGTDPLIAQLAEAFPSAGQPSGPKIKEIESSPASYERLCSFATGLMSLLFPQDIQSRLPQTLITTSILNRHIPDILKPCLLTGWLPKSLSSESMVPLNSMRPMTLRLLAIILPSQSITSLGSVMSMHPLPSYVRRACTALLSGQLLRTEGVRGLCAAVFGEDKSDTDVDLEKLQHVARVITSVPSHTEPQEYFKTIIPRVVNILNDEHLPYRRAAAFSLSRMLGTDPSYPHIAVAPKILLPLMHNAFYDFSLGSSSHIVLTPTVALSSLVLLITNTDPSPTLISTLLSPIVPPLYSLLHHLEHVKTSDPTLKESIRNLLSTWARVVPTSESVEQLWLILDGGEMDWEVTITSEIRRVHKLRDPNERLSLFTPENLTKAEDAGELDVNANILDLYPDPSHFVSFLKLLDQNDISTTIFIQLLEKYYSRKQHEETDPEQSLLYLQLIMQMQSELSGTPSSSNLLKRPDHILTFIKHALESTSKENKRNSAAKQQRSEINIRTPDITQDGDSDDDMSDSEAFTTDDEMSETSITLLLSILEANESLSARSAPVLNEIFELLEPMTRVGPDMIRPLAKEARIVMTARLASTSTDLTSRKVTQDDDGQETYQKALKLLQDPILPVRAHGLLLLRQLVADSNNGPQNLNPALAPAILSIFLQSAQDDDSYIFLNAVQGLASMVDGMGKETLKGLVQDYCRGLGSVLFTQQEVDTRTRIGEALSLVIKRCGSALSSYRDIIVPSIFNIVRSSSVPTTLRTSALSLLADCANTQAMSLLPYFFDLSDGMVDLLQVESISGGSFPTKLDQERKEDIMDDNPTSTNSKFPPLRRAALHFLQTLVQRTISLIYDDAFGADLLSIRSIKRARTILEYVAMSDSDSVVRVMARETNEDMIQLESAISGL